MAQLGWTATETDGGLQTFIYLTNDGVSIVIALMNDYSNVFVSYPTGVDYSVVKGLDSETNAVIGEEEKGFQCVICDGTGVCDTCDGKGVWCGFTCFECGGNGICPFCHGDGWVAPDENYKDVPKGVCPICEGSGICQICHGTGRVTGIATYGQGGNDYVTCSGCDGSGECEYCQGTGKDEG